MTESAWNQWAGLPVLPVPANAVVNVKLRSSKTINGVQAKHLLWGRAKREVAANDNLTNGGEIVAYQIQGDVELVARLLNMRLHGATELGQRTQWISDAILAERSRCADIARNSSGSEEAYRQIMGETA